MHLKKTICLAAALLAVSAWAENVLRGDFLPDNYGGLVDWTLTGQMSFLRLEEKGPEGGPVVRLAKGSGALVHSTLQLVKNEDYRMSFWVRTKDARGPRLEFQDLRARLWHEKYPIPANTQGQWQKLEWSIKVGPSHDNYYNWRVMCAAFPKEGFLDISDPQLEPVSEQAKQKTHRRSTNQPYRARVTPVDPEVNGLDAADARMTFHFSGTLPKEPSKLTLKVALAGREVMAELGVDKRATVRFGALDEGSHRAVARVVDAQGQVLAENTYVLRTAPQVKNPTPLKKLNNFVSEIASRPLANEDITFVFARAGWVYLGLDKPVKGVTASLDGKPVLAWDDGLYMETMRWVSAGAHTVKVSGVSEGAVGRLNLRRVKYIYGRNAFSWFYLKPKRKYAGNSFDHAYQKRFGLDRGFNLAVLPAANAKIWQAGTQQAAIRQDLLERGVYVTYGTACFLETAPIRNDPADYADVLFNNEAGRRGLPCCFEENTVRAPRLMKYNAANLWWDANLRQQRLDMYYADLGRMHTFVDPDFDIPEMAGYANGGTGEGVMIHEAYYSAPGTREGLDNVYRTMKEQMAQMEQLVPCYVSHLISLCNTFMTVGSWTSWVMPECDYKGFLSRYMQLMATDPAYANIAGIGLPGIYCDEDYYRFAKDALRHYCIEGATDDYGARYGISDLPGYMDNGDFLNGFSGWTVEPAAEGTLVAGSRKGLGTYMRRHRNKFIGPECLGETYAQLTRASNGVSRLSRTITGLAKGECYQLVFASFNLDELDNPKTKPQDRETAIKVSFTGATEMPEFTTAFGAGDARFTKFQITTHRHVVRATDDTLTFTLSDGDGLPPGERRCINYVGFRRCYFKDPKDLEDLSRMYRATCPKTPGGS